MAYQFPLPYLVHRFKFHHDLVAGRLLADLFCTRARAFPRPQALLPVPLSAAKLRKRGFNQAVELARGLARTLDLALLSGVVERRQDHEMVQSRLHSRQARQGNVRGVFHVKPQGRPIIESRHIAIVDDVLTSGATATALSRLLLDYGAEQVDVWVLARA